MQKYLRYLTFLFLLIVMYSCTSQSSKGAELTSDSILRISKENFDKTISALVFMDLALSALPDEIIEDFAVSPMYDIYKEIFEIFGLAGLPKTSLLSASDGGYLVSGKTVLSLRELLFFMKDMPKHLKPIQREKLENSKDYEIFLFVIEFYERIE